MVLRDFSNHWCSETNEPETWTKASYEKGPWCGPVLDTEHKSDEEPLPTLDLRDQSVWERLSPGLADQIFRTVARSAVSWTPRDDLPKFDKPRAIRLAVNLCHAVADEIESAREMQEYPKPDMELEGLVGKHVKILAGYGAGDTGVVKRVIPQNRMLLVRLDQQSILSEVHPGVVEVLVE